MRPAAIATLFLFAVSARGEPKAKPLPVTGEAQPKLAAIDKLILDYLTEQKVPGAAVAVAKDGRLVYARGFGYADPDHKIAIQPTSLFRLASASKPFTVAAICQLVEQGKLKFDDKIFDLLQLKDSSRLDGRWKKITIAQLIMHRAGFDREKSGDPMAKSVEIAKALKIPSPPKPDQIIKYMLTQPIENEPGTKEVYSNFGFCLLGRVIEKVSGKPYDKYVIDELLKPIGIQDMQIGKSLTTAKGEVRYFDPHEPTGTSVFASLGTKNVPSPYGAFCLESMDSHGGWIASAIDLARFGSAIDYPDRFPAYKGMGFKANFFPEYVHFGAINGSSAMVRRFPNGITVGLLFNSRKSNGTEELCQDIHDRLKDLLYKVESWPEGDLFPQYLSVK
jgi:N-acyl-D-amino-acid deacylase